MLYCPISNWQHFYLQNKTADNICKMEKHHNNTAESKETHYNVKQCAASKMGPGPIGSLPLTTPLEMPLPLPLGVFYTV